MKSRKHKKKMVPRLLHRARNQGEWVPFGYYKNRPKVMLRFAEQMATIGIPTIGNFRFITS
jgi:hypothetical protein